VALEEVPRYSRGKRVYYYGGRDQSIIQTFTSGGSYLLHLSRENPRRSLQSGYIKAILKVEEAPDRAMVTKVYQGPDLNLSEVALLLRITTTLAEDYLLPNAKVSFADITHGVAILVEGNKDNLRIYLARDSGIVRPVQECYRTAYNVFSAFVKDFVRVHLYQRIHQFVPSSTREGADALLELLLRSRELYRYEESEFGPLDPLLGDYLSGQKSFEEVIKATSSKMRSHTQTVTSSQVGSIEEQLPDIQDAPAPTEEETQEQFGATPPILRTDVYSTMKVFVATKAYPQLNNFGLFLGLSDRLFNRDGTFFFEPHTSKIIWGSHRIIYIFTHASGKLTLYYDIELKEPLQEQKTGGGMFPTTTIITKNRIYVPVPPELVDAFRVTVGAKEFFVRFDLL
jgi:molecular chaperone HtpG